MESKGCQNLRSRRVSEKSLQCFKLIIAMMSTSAVKITQAFLMKYFQDQIIWCTYAQKYWDTCPNYWIHVFQSDPLPHVYKIKHRASSRINKHYIFFLMFWRAQEELIGCHLCSSWNFIPSWYFWVSCKWYYWNVEVFRNNSNSTTK